MFQTEIWAIFAYFFLFSVSFLSRNDQLDFLKVRFSRFGDFVGVRRSSRDFVARFRDSLKEVDLWQVYDQFAVQFLCSHNIPYTFRMSLFRFKSLHLAC